ncbi:MAG: hypothetical protein C4548_08820 [Desulfobacteraceae bacterium]|jgi:hypothetical protein|nr:MAG: hypothetical protein C4548_08820 [Desulfobacteraceae bacterium]
MKVDPAKNYAVVSGDFIGFSGLPAETRESSYHLVKQAGAELARLFPSAMPWEVDMFRGDGWQFVLADPVISLRAALFFRAYLRARAGGHPTDVRLAIGVGPIDYVPDNRVSAGDGTAFRLSGRLLDQIAMQKTGSMRFVMEDEKLSLPLDGITLLIGALADNWTERQARAVAGALQGLTIIQITEQWPDRISRQAVGKHLARTRWPEIRIGLKIFESTAS